MISICRLDAWKSSVETLVADHYLTENLVNLRRALLVCAPSPREIGSAPVATVKIVRAMLDAGWVVDILGYRWDPTAPTDAFFCTMLHGATVYEDGGVLGKPSGWVHRAVRTGRWLLAAHSYDVMVSFAHLTWTHVVALRLKRYTDVPWVAFFSDPWSNHTYIRPSFLRGLFERRLEFRTYSTASALVFTNRRLRDWMLGQFPGHDKWLAKCFDIPYFFDSSITPDATTESANGTIRIRHLGAIPPGSYATALFEAIAMLVAEDPSLRDSLCVEFFGSYRSDHGDAIARMQLERWVRFRKPVGYLESLKLMKESSLLLFLGVPTNELQGLGNVTLHLKMSDYLGAGRPIFALAAAGSPAHDALGTGSGFCDSNDPMVVKQSLQRFIANPAAPGAAVRERYSREAVFPLWEQVLNRVSRLGSA